MSNNLHVSLQNRPKKSTTYCKSKGNQKFQMCLSQNYDFVFTNLLKNEAESTESHSFKCIHLFSIRCFALGSRP